MNLLRIGDRVEIECGLRQSQAISEPGSRQWCAVTIQHDADRTAEQHVNALGYETYLPRYKIEVRDRRRHRRLIEVERPLFVGYLFARLNPLLDPWGAIERTMGVRRLVYGVGRRPSVIPTAFIHELKVRAHSNFALPSKRRDQAPTFNRGDAVRICTGPLAGLTAQFFERLPDRDERGRIALLVELLGQMSKVEMFVDGVEAV